MGGDLAAVQALVSKGADVNVKTNDGQTALSLAARVEGPEALVSSPRSWG